MDETRPQQAPPADEVGPEADPRPAWAALIAAVALAAFAWWFLLGGGIERFRPRGAEPSGSGGVGQPAPDFALDTPASTTIRLAELRGSVVLLNFWATWCTPCRAEMPEFESAYREYRDRGFAVLAVDVEERAEEVEPFMRELGLTFPALLDLDGSVSRAYRARALPSSFLVDRDGVVRYVRVGALTKATLEAELKKLL